MKQKKKILIIAGVVAASLIAVLCEAVFILNDLFSDNSSEPNEQEIAEYNRLAENYAHFTGSFIEIVPIDELAGLFLAARQPFFRSVFMLSLYHIRRAVMV